QIIDDFIQDKPRFQKIVTKKEIGILKGKTNALANGIEISTGEIILTTDADCTFPSTWAKTLASYYIKDVGIVNGFTTQKAFDQFSGMQSIDFIYLLMAAAGTMNLGHPISCIGNNMSYRRKAYDEVGGYEKLPFSVTEDFQLLNSIYKTKKYKIILPLNPDSLVTTKPLPDIKSLYKQKKRWGVGGLGVPIRGYFVMLFGFITNLAVLATPFFYSREWMIYTIFKIFIDYLAMYTIHSHLGIKKNLKYFPIYELYFLFYVVALPFSIGFNRRVTWKGRQY
ncbi:MAG: glycosyltransferase family 2 protein, partial [Syntrophothermus sp.]